MKLLFYLKGQDTNIEVFAENQSEAFIKAKEILGEQVRLKTILATENFNCPKCGCHASECNLPS